MNEQINILLDILEEIKQQNREIKSNISNLASKPVSNSVEGEISLNEVVSLLIKNLELDRKFKDELKESAVVLGKRMKEIKENIDRSQEKQTENINSLSVQFKEKVDGLVEQSHEKLNSLAAQIKENQNNTEVKNYYLFDVKKWAEWLIGGMLIVFSACMIGWAAYLHQANKTMENYALGYRILRMQQGSSNPAIAQLDSLFSSDNSTAIIRNLKQKVINYEQALKRQAELLLQQQKLTKEQEKLQREIGGR